MNKIEAMYQRPFVNVKIERGSTFTFTRDYPYISSILFNHNYNKILESDWLSTALISALIGQLNRTVRVMPKELDS